MSTVILIVVLVGIYYLGRYAIDCEKIKKELEWEIDTSFGDGIRKTIDWYIKKLK